MIDEGPPSLPPILTREVDKVVTTPETPDVRFFKFSKASLLNVC
jgi:hypothetical protein